MRTAAACFMWFLALSFMAMAPEVKVAIPVEFWRYAGAAMSLCVLADFAEIPWARLWTWKERRPAGMDVTVHSKAGR